MCVCLCLCVFVLLLLLSLPPSFTLPSCCHRQPLTKAASSAARGGRSWRDREGPACRTPSYWPPPADSSSVDWPPAAPPLAPLPFAACKSTQQSMAYTVRAFLLLLSVLAPRAEGLRIRIGSWFCRPRGYYVCWFCRPIGYFIWYCVLVL